MSRRTASSRSGSTVDMEVANLFKLQNKAQFTNALMSLRKQYNDEELVNRVQDVFMQRHSAIVKSAKKFATAVREKYAQQNVPFHQLLMKARAHGKKHHLSEAEFAEFQRIYEQELAGTNSSEVLMPMTSIMKVLGNITSGTEGFFKVDEADYRNLQEILKLNEASRPLHAQVLLQAIQYTGLSPLDLAAATFDKNIHNPGDHVHPVVAALFAPKIKMVDDHFLYSNMSGIVKSRYNHVPLTTRPDYELLYNLITDPNDVVCDTRTPVADLLHRCNLQNQLWNSVLHLRNNQCYNPSLREFMSSVDVCRLNKFDNPDLIYGRHDGTIIKRLFSAFSFRPTVVATLPVANLFAYNPYSQNLRPTVTSIPMINFRVSNFGSVAAAAAAAIYAPGLGAAAGTNKLSLAIAQTNQFLEGNSVVNRHTSVMFSRELLVFYVDRRSYAFNTNTVMTNMARLPTAIAGFERITDIAIDLEEKIELGGKGASKETFTLKSFVVADVNSNISANTGNPINDTSNYVIGSSAYIKPVAVSGATAPTDDVMYHYSPTQAIKRTGDMFKVYSEITKDGDAPAKAAYAAAIAAVAAGTGKIANPPTPDQLGWEDAATKRGVIFIYINDKYSDKTLDI